MDAIHSTDETISPPAASKESSINDNDTFYFCTSEIFNAPDAEIRFQSFDGVVFRIHKINLNACTHGFSPPEHCTFHEIVPLPEQSRILELLFQFIYPQPQPDLSTLPFDDLLMLAEAAENIRNRKRLPENAEDVLVHGLRHKILKLVDGAAPLLLHRPLEDVLASKLGSDYSPSYRRYQMQWMEASRASLSHLADLHTQYPNACAKCIIQVTSELNSRIATPQNLDSIFTVLNAFGHHGCNDPFFLAWRESLETAIKKLPCLTDIVFPREEEHLSHNSDLNIQNGMPNLKPQEISVTSQRGSVKVMSSDGITYYLDPDSIRVCAEGLLQGELKELIAVPLDSTMLALLVQFIQRSPHPDLSTVDDITLLQIYEAASKYKVFAAINLCQMRLNDLFAQQGSLESHTAVVMKYALLLKDYELVDKAAVLLVGKLSLAGAVKFLGLSEGIAWRQGIYCAQWDAVSRRAFSTVASQRKVSRETKRLRNGRYIKLRKCDYCQSGEADAITIGILRRLGENPASLQDLDDVFDLNKSCCYSCREDMCSWRNGVKAAMAEIRKFSVLLLEGLGETDAVSTTY
ncbi:hypothetical protein H0H92_012752 [Tricholoma furcatifolium]|nr:hypothetical protein H0H92_012752 [Tricholoma furcatifolium]